MWEEGKVLTNLGVFPKEESFKIFHTEYVFITIYNMSHDMEV